MSANFWQAFGAISAAMIGVAGLCIPIATKLYRVWSRIDRRLDRLEAKFDRHIRQHDNNPVSRRMERRRNDYPDYP